MKQPLKNEVDVLGLINKIQAQLIVLDKKIDTLINRSLPEARPSPMPLVDSSRSVVRPNDRNKGRVMHTAICADCKKECTIPFKPSGDRPVYCQDCFSRRKVISLSGISVVGKPKEIVLVQPLINKVTDVPKLQVKGKKKAGTVKKTIGKKKLVPKKK